MPPRTPMNIQCTRDHTAANIQATQVEWSWDPSPDVGGPPRVWWDVSNVAGRPFIDEGLVYAVGDQNAAAAFVTCTSGRCGPGEETCEQIYDYPTEDVVSTLSRH